ncbi:MFS transporter [Chungangia koreensis]|uniref:MFS transporter n=1 Tax=Chungangia koreensis TaxID=752657 RepID=A0ABV8X3N4_9LACT
MSEEQKLKRATYHLWTFTISKLLSTFGASVFAFGAGLFVLEMTGSAANFAITMVCSILPRMLLAPIAGYIADNYPKKPIIIIAQIGSVLAVSTLLAYSLIFDITVLSIYVVTAVLSITSLFSGVTFSSSIATLVGPDRIQKAMSFNQSSIAIATIGGPAVGGMLYGWTTMTVFLLFQIVGYAIAVILESTMNFRLYSKREQNVQSEQKKESVIEGIKSGISYLKTQKIISLIVWVSLWINFFFAALNVGMPYVLREQLFMKSTHFGYVEAILSVGMLLGSLYFAARAEVKYPLQFSKRGVLVLIALLALFPIPSVIELPYYGNFVYYLALMFSFGVTLMLINTPIGVVMQKEIEEEYKGRVFGLLETMAQAMMPLGAIIFGLLFDVVAAEWVIWGACLFLIAIVLYLMRPSIIVQAHPELDKKESLKHEAKTAV